MVEPSGEKRAREASASSGEIWTQSASPAKVPSARTEVAQMTVLPERRRMKLTHFPSHERLGDKSSMPWGDSIWKPVAGEVERRCADPPWLSPLRRHHVLTGRIRECAVDDQCSVRRHLRPKRSATSLKDVMRCENRFCSRYAVSHHQLATASVSATVSPANGGVPTRVEQPDRCSSPFAS
jgi:hypothetical protein